MSRRVNAAIRSNKIANEVLRIFGEALVEKWDEICATRTAEIPIKIGTCHLTVSHSEWCPRNEINELRAMMSKDVPAAFACGVPKKRTKTGMARKPPPIPKIPVIEPMKREIRMSKGSGIRVSG